MLLPNCSSLGYSEIEDQSHILTKHCGTKVFNCFVKKDRNISYLCLGTKYKKGVSGFPVFAFSLKYFPHISQYVGLNVFST